jgi:hypothetical protein
VARALYDLIQDLAGSPILFLIMWAHRYLESEVDAIDVEAETARLELVNYLVRVMIPRSS